MSDMLEHLKRILPPPVVPIDAVGDGGWRSVEERLGLCLPSDYKVAVSTYGLGSIDGFVWLLSPFTHNVHLNLFCEIKRCASAFQEFKKLTSSEIPYELYPLSPRGLVPWAITDNGDVLYWIRDADREYLVGQQSRVAEWAEWRMSITEFLVGLVDRSICVPFFPDDFPSENPSFAPATPPFV